jgi:hypothetical protein
LVGGELIPEWDPDRLNPHTESIVVIDNTQRMPNDRLDTRGVMDSTLQRAIYGTDPSARFAA